MLSLSIGPVALPMAPLLLLLAVWGASWLASVLEARQAAATGPAGPAEAGHAIVLAAGLGLLAARAAHLVAEAPSYATEPLRVFDLRDGGWLMPAGVLVGAAWLLWRGRQRPALRRPLLLSSASGALCWTVATLAIGTGQGQAMPALSLSPLNGGPTVDLRAAAAGRPVVVNLWASWCGPCRAEMPVLAQAQQREPDIGFLFVNQGESAATVHAYLAGQRLALREVLLDAGSQLGPAVGSRGLPTTLFYDAGGRLVDAHMGVLHAAALDARLRALRRASPSR